MTRIPIRRALVSVYDKAGLVDLATGLHAAGVEIVSTGSTALAVATAGVPVTQVSEVTGFPEILDGRVKTLHPRIHAGLLADSRNAEHLETLEAHGIAPFQVVVANLYPFAATVASGAGADECVDQIDIGGPSAVRAAAKNHASVAVVTDPAAYGEVLAAVAAGGFSLNERRQLAAAAFRHTASYDIAVASWMGGVLAPTDDSGWPAWVATEYTRRAVLRYGENPHQRAALYAGARAGDTLATAEQMHGKAMSYNNYVDADAALRAAHDQRGPCVAIIKHANPCGIAVGDDVAEAHRKAHACDPVSAFGGVIAVNRPVSIRMAEQVAAVFTEVLVGPDYEPGAIEILTRKPSIRLLRTTASGWRAFERRQICGGLLLQTFDPIGEPGDEPAGWRQVAGSAVDESTQADLGFAWRAVRAVKSNAILLAADGATVGVGMGQVNRVDAARLAVSRAGARASGSVAASDAFFPFADGFEVLATAGVRAVVEPGGSVRDEEVIAAAEKTGVALLFTGVRHFAH